MMMPDSTSSPADTTPFPGSGTVRIVAVFNSGYKEYVEITNSGTQPVDLAGWSVTGSRGDEQYMFPTDYSLAPGAGVRLHSGDGGVDSPPTDIYWTSKTVWNNQGETVYLRDALGNLMDSYSY